MRGYSSAERKSSLQSYLDPTGLTGIFDIGFQPTPALRPGKIPSILSILLILYHQHPGRPRRCRQRPMESAFRALSAAYSKASENI